jgi:hypothetical protein
MTPCGDLVILREYVCGCLVYLDELEREFTERGLFCDGGAYHAQTMVRGIETQPSLFRFQ